MSSPSEIQLLPEVKASGSQSGAKVALAESHPSHPESHPESHPSRQSPKASGGHKGRRPSITLPMNPDGCDMASGASAPRSPASPGSRTSRVTSASQASPKSARSVRYERRNSNTSAIADVPEMVEASPRGLKFTRTSVLLFVFYFVLSANDGIVKSKSNSVKIEGQPDACPYALASVMLMSCCVSLCTGIAMAVYHDGMEEGLRKCLDIDSIKRVAPINGLFQVAFVMKFEALRRLDPDIVSMLSQSNLVLLALAARFIMGRRYKRRQWTFLIMITLSMWLYLINRDGKHMLGQGPQFQPMQHITGYFIVIAMCIIETVATVLAEAFLKHWQAPAKKPGSRTSKSKGDKGSSGSDVAAACGQSPAKTMHSEQSPPQVLPFWVQKVHVETSGLFFMVVWIFVLPYFLHGPEWDWICMHSRQIHDSGNVLSGWDRWTVAVLITVIVKAWLAGLVSKLLDSVMKQIGSCLSILLTYVEVVIWLDPAGSRPTTSTLVALAMVLISIVLFADAERQRSRPRRNISQDWTAKYKGLSGDLDASRKKERLERMDSTTTPGCDMRPFRSMRPFDGPHSETESNEPHAESLQRSRRYRSVHKTSSEDPERHQNLIGADGV